ncbi:MAG TPA: HlyD family efflux transporter periplasmic adaptor subunit [Polyangiaceae bacterium]|nr:HlyD family efflux transporter periplasmic adaptor subunit [Polyangiaceae bacterium]
MINNSIRAVLAAGAVVALAGCEAKPAHPGAFQGVIEFDERALGFEVGGRIAKVTVQRGAAVRAGQLLASLDDTLQRTSREGREAEAKVAAAEAALLKAGSRPEEVQSTQAQVRAARAREALLEKNLARERVLLEERVVSAASVDDLESRLRTATAERQAIEQRVRELQNGARRQEIDRAEARSLVADTQAKLEDERVRRFELHAAEDGVVLDVHAEPSEVVAAGAPVVSVADTKHPYADVFVPQAELDGVESGAGAKIHVDATSNEFAGKVESVGRKTEFTPRYLFSDRERNKLVVRVRVRIDDPDERLHAGVPAFVSIERAQAPKAEARHD